MACFRQSKRRAAQFLSMILNQPASAGWMVLLQNRAAAAVKPAYDELAEQLATQAVRHIDESPTKEGPAKAWVWTFVAATFTFFTCRTSRAAEVLGGRRDLSKSMIRTLAEKWGLDANTLIGARRQAA